MKIAIVQDGPVFNDLTKTLEKTQDFISQAEKEKVDLIVFGESWLCGYPVWLDVCKDANLWDHPPIKEVWAEMYNNSIDVSTDQMSGIQKQLAQGGMFGIFGANEKQTKGKGNQTIYNAILTYDNNGTLVNHHRKLMPTYTEKLVHGLGDGAGLKSVDTPFGKLGSLICWEHWMPMARVAMHDEGEDLHIALWPFVKGMHHIASRHYAIEGRCHVVSVGQMMHRNELPKGLELSETVDKGQDYLLKGGSAIYGPDGEYIMEPLYEKKEMIIRELDLSKNTGERMNLSVSGHYQRHDVFDYTVNKIRKK